MVYRHVDDTINILGVFIDHFGQLYGQCFGDFSMAVARILGMDPYLPTLVTSVGHGYPLPLQGSRPINI
jgi:hypothetical protein